MDIIAYLCSKPLIPTTITGNQKSKAAPRPHLERSIVAGGPLKAFSVTDEEQVARSRPGWSCKQLEAWVIGAFNC